MPGARSVSSANTAERSLSLGRGSGGGGPEARVRGVGRNCRLDLIGRILQNPLVFQRHQTAVQRFHEPRNTGGERCSIGGAVGAESVGQAVRRRHQEFGRNTIPYRDRKSTRLNYSP